MIWKDIAYKFMKKIRGTPSYWTVALYDTLAMLRTFGTPTWCNSMPLVRRGPTLFVVKCT